MCWPTMGQQSGIGARSLPQSSGKQDYVSRQVEKNLTEVLLMADAGAQQVFTSREAIAEEQEKLNLLGFYGQNGKPLREDGILDQDTLLAWNDKTYGGVLLGSNNSPMAKAQREWEKGERKTNNGEAIERLSEILDRQYPKTETVNLKDIDSIGDLVKAIKGWLADSRMNNNFAVIDKNRDAILETASRFNIPAEVIASVILKEQYTQSLPDSLANITTALWEINPWLGELGNKILSPIIEKRKLFGTHSLGLGAIFPETAREAVGYMEEAGIETDLPNQDWLLQARLGANDYFNIQMIAAVPAQKAASIGMIDSIDDLGSLSYEDWQKVLVVYNGGEDYGQFVREYLPYMRDYLRLD